MEKVLGLGGIFFKARDPETLAQWYQTHLGLPVEDFGGVFGANLPMLVGPRRGYQLWTAFPQDSGYFPGGLMINFRVLDLDALLAQLRAAGVAVEDKVEESDFGRFGWLTDPEGNRVELWQVPEPRPI